MNIFSLSVPIPDQFNKNIFIVDYFIESDSEPVFGDFLDLAKKLHEEKKCVNFYFFGDMFSNYCNEHIKAVDVIYGVIKKYNLEEGRGILNNDYVDRPNTVCSRFPFTHEGFDVSYLTSSKVEVYKK